MGVGLIIVAVVVALALYVVFAFNRFVTLRNKIKNAWAQIDVQLKRRYDLIPNLVETVKGYAGHERATFEAVTKARAQAVGVTNVKDRAQAENMLTGALKNLFALAENYPELKANENFMMFQEELAGTEDKIAGARQSYNDSVMTYNISREQFPANIIAGVFRFGPEEMFEVEITAEREPVKAKFD